MKGKKIMKKRELRSEAFGSKRTNSKLIGKMLVHWLLPVSNNEFAPYKNFLKSEKIPDESLNDNEFLKKLYLKRLLELKRIDQIVRHLSYLNRPFRADVLDIFLCSKMAVKWFRVVYPLISYVEGDEWAENLWHNYLKILVAGAENIYYLNKKTSKKKYLPDTYFSVEVENRLRYVDYDLLSRRYECNPMYSVMFAWGFPINQ